MSLCDTCKHYSRTTEKCTNHTFIVDDVKIPLSAVENFQHNCCYFEEMENKPTFTNNDNPTPAHPTHYSRLNPEPIDVINSWNMGFDLGNVIKYVARAGHKDGNSKLQDLEKAKYYLEHEINILKSSV